MTTQTLRVSEPRDVLSMIGFQLGFTPTDSLVAVSLRGPRARIGLVMRVDLPAPDDVAAVARQVVDHLVADGAGSALAVVYSGDGPDAAAHPVVDAVVQGLDGCRVDVRDVWHVGPHRYRSLMCVRECCPAEGFPVADLQGSLLGAEMTYRGLTVARSRADVAGDLRPADAARRREVERVAQAHLRPGTEETADPQLVAWRDVALAAWRRQLGSALAERTEVPIEDAGVLLAGLPDVVVRDAVMLTCVPDHGDAPDRLLREGGDSAGAHVLFDRVFEPERAVRPCEETVREADRVLRSLARQASGASTAPPLAVLGWLAWWAGEGVLATECLDRALAADPTHRLARLLVESVDRGVPPGWVQRDRLADLAGWQRDHP